VTQLTNAAITSSSWHERTELALTNKHQQSHSLQLPLLQQIIVKIQMDIYRVLHANVIPLDGRLCCLGTEKIASWPRVKRWKEMFRNYAALALQKLLQTVAILEVASEDRFQTGSSTRGLIKGRVDLGTAVRARQPVKVPYGSGGSRGDKTQLHARHHGIRSRDVAIWHSSVTRYIQSGMLCRGFMGNCCIQRLHMKPGQRSQMTERVREDEHDEHATDCLQLRRRPTTSK